ncbi:MAG TPA: carbohydrate kinase [Treponemataceae bacterium]|nr:carbohydrate kinase [Treponemataceae bacterium]
MKEIDVIALGEILIDFTSAGISSAGQALYERNAGGAPANVAAAVARLGGRSGFIGKIGTDSFGIYLRQTLENLGVQTSGLSETSDQHTTLAFVSLSSNGEREFSFCRNPGADTCLEEADLAQAGLEKTKFLHIGSLSLTHEPARSATHAAIKAVREAGGYISYDPNWRKPLWSSQEEGIIQMKSLIPLAHMVKVSEEELHLLYGVNPETDLGLAKGAALIRNEGPSFVMVTLGPRGVYYQNSVSSGIVEAPVVKVQDTTGAGDSFVGGLLYRFSKLPEGVSLFDRRASEIEEDLYFANAVASMCVTRRGAIPAMPDLSEVTKLIQNASFRSRS